MSATLKRTPLADEHIASGARMVDFGGWDMPLAYGSQLKSTTPCARTPACSMSRTCSTST